MIVNVPAFFLFSTIESASIFALTFYIFRFGVKHYVKEILFASFMIACTSYSVRIVFEFPVIFPIVGILLYAFFTHLILRVPYIWSLIMSGIIFILFAVSQTSLLLLATAFDLVEFRNVTNYQNDAFILQLISSAINLIVGFWLYHRGYGFTFPFHRFRWKNENIIIMTTVFISYIYLTVQLISDSLSTGILIGVLLLLLLLYFLFRKERADQ